jgi:hypothetical protein
VQFIQGHAARHTFVVPEPMGEMNVKAYSHVLCVMALLAACRGEATGAHKKSDRTSTTVVVSAAPIEGVKLPNGGEEPSISMPVGVALLSGGRVALVDQFSLRLYVFDAAGRYVGSGGGKGEGPGQFQNVHGMASIGGDSIGIWDSQLRRLSVFTGEPRFVRVERIDVADDAPMGRRLLGRFRDGRFVMLEEEYGENQADGRGTIRELRRTIRVGSGADAKSFPLPSLRYVVAGGGNEFYLVGVPMNQLRRVQACDNGLLVQVNAGITAYDTGFNVIGSFTPPVDSTFSSGAERMRDIERNIGDKSRNLNWKRDRDMVDRLQPKTLVQLSTGTLDGAARLWYYMGVATGGSLAMKRTTLAGAVLDTISLRRGQSIYAADSSVYVGRQFERDTIDAAVILYRLPNARPVQDKSPAMGHCNESWFF